VSTFIASQHSAAAVEALASGAIRPGRARIRTILLATDLSPISDPAAIEAIDLCGALGARLLVVNVIDARQSFGKQLRPVARASRLDQIRADRERSLLDVVGKARAVGIDASFLVWTGEPGQSIVSAAEAEGADLIVVGTRALDRAGRFLLGSVSDYVVNHSPCPVLIAR
jgi:nucleotide-binding universal stress UspA family protein